MQKKSFFCYLKNRFRTNKVFPAVLLVYIAFCLGSFVYFLILGQPRDYLLSVGFIALAPVLCVSEYFLQLRFPSPLAASLLLLGAGCILGSGYDLYTVLPFFDTVLHGISGAVFACLGFGVMRLIVGNSDGKRSFVACLIFGFVFSLAIAVVWELFEYAITSLFGFDMQEDTIVRGFGSYLLAGTHSDMVEINDIVQTVIRYGDGQTYVIDGYLDIGLIDTVADMAICLAGAVVYLIAMTVDRLTVGKLDRLMIPRLVGNARRRRRQLR